jgi:uncharacterized membrane protein YfcA
VSAATGLYLVTYSKIATSLVYFLNGEMDVEYALWLGFWSVFGSIAGSAGAWFYMKVSGRQSFIIWILVAMFVLQILTIPTLGWILLFEDIANGVDIGEFSKLC